MKRTIEEKAELFDKVVTRLQIQAEINTKQLELKQASAQIEKELIELIFGKPEKPKSSVEQEPTSALPVVASKPARRAKQSR